MKKVSTAISALGLFVASGCAMAQSNVTVYGVLDAGLVRETGGVNGSVTNVGSGMAAGSRLGFKGREDLGGGNAAFFQIENGLHVDTGQAGQGGRLFGRQAFVGLTGAPGTITLGRQYSPYYNTVERVADPFEVGFAGTASNLMATHTRVDNMIEYVAPTFYGVTIDLATGMGEVPGDSKKNRVFSGALTYAQGPLIVALAWHQQQNALANDQTRNTILTGKYKAGFGDVSLGYAVNNELAGAESRDAIVGLALPVGTGTAFGSYIRHDDRRATKRDANQWAVGYSHPLSKRTDLYAAYARISNHNGASFKVGNATDDGSGHTGTNVGIRHKF